MPVSPVPRHHTGSRFKMSKLGDVTVPGTAHLTPVSAINRYLVVLFASWVLVVAVTLNVLIQTLDLVGNSNAILAAPGATTAALWRYAELRFPILISQFLPFSVLLASLATLGTLAHTNQIVILRAAGLSPHQILRPIIVVSVLIAFAHFCFDEGVVVDAQRDLDAWESANYGAQPAQSFETRSHVWVERNGWIVRAGRAVREGEETLLFDVMALRYAGVSNLQEIIFARSAKVSSSHSTLDEIRDIDVQSQETHTSFHENWDFKSPPDLFFSQETAPAQIGFAALLRALKQADSSHAATLAVALYRKVTWPLSSVLMPVLAVVVGYAHQRRGYIALGAAIGLALGFSYFVVESIVTAMGRSGGVPPLLAAFAPIFAFLAMAEYRLARIEV